MLHETQGPSQATLQQTESAQNPDWQSASFAQCPPGIGPQLPVAKSQAWAPVHWAVALQAVTQALVVVSQVYGTHTVATAPTHWPLPSHAPPPITSSPLHTGRAVLAPSQLVPGGETRHMPAPSHSPSSPQVAAPSVGQSDTLRGAAPAASLVQVPTRPGAAQVLQPPVQAVEQQTPSAQKPLWHWQSPVQLAPMSCPGPSDMHAAPEPSVEAPSEVAPSTLPSLLGAGWLLLHAAAATTQSASAIATGRKRKPVGKRVIRKDFIKMRPTGRPAPTVRTVPRVRAAALPFNRSRRLQAASGPARPEAEAGPASRPSQRAGGLARDLLFSLELA
jgi:hypothetical protein